MPTPRKDETKDDFLDRCIPELKEEGKKQDEAIAQCISIWEEDQDNQDNAPESRHDNNW